MKQVWALGDYDKETYHIHDMAGYRYAVDATIAATDIQVKIPQMCANTHSAPVQSWDEESVVELKLSRNDLCKKLHRTICEQVIEAEKEMVPNIDFETDSETDSEMDSETDSKTTESTAESTSAFDADEESNSGEEVEGNSDDERLGNASCHKVPSIRVAGGTRVA